MVAGISRTVPHCPPYITLSIFSETFLDDSTGGSQDTQLAIHFKVSTSIMSSVDYV